MQSYSPDIESLLATTNHGERVIVVGPASDPARATVRPVAPGAETFDAPAKVMRARRIRERRAAARRAQAS